MAKCLGIEIKKVEAKNKIHINGDRSEPLLAALMDIKNNNPNLWNELSKVIQFNFWDGYSLNIYEPEEQ